VFDSTLEDVAAVTEIIGLLTLVSGLIFGISQLRAHRIEQRIVVATSLWNVRVDVSQAGGMDTGEAGVPGSALLGRVVEWLARLSVKYKDENVLTNEEVANSKP